MTLPKIAIIDRDSTLNYASSNPDSPLYYIKSHSQLILKPGAKEAVQLLNACGIPLILATKQRCVGKGFVSRDEVFKINECLERMLGIQFHSVYVEEIEDNKAGLYREILDKTGVKSSEAILFDDSGHERLVAGKMGIASFDGYDILGSVKDLLLLQ